MLVTVIMLAVTNINKKNSNRKTTFENENAISNVQVKNITFENIRKTFEGNITNIKADVYNNTDKMKNINVKVILKDSNGKELKSMIQIIENIEPGRKKLLQTSIVGNYSDVNDIEFKIISDSELE